AGLRTPWKNRGPISTHRGTFFSLSWGERVPHFCLLDTAGMILSHIFLAGHRSREMALRSSLVNRVAFLAEKAAATCLCPGGPVWREARFPVASRHRG